MVKHSRREKMNPDDTKSLEDRQKEALVLLQRIQLFGIMGQGLGELHDRLNDYIQKAIPWSGEILLPEHKMKLIVNIPIKKIHKLSVAMRGIE